MRESSNWRSDARTAVTTVFAPEHGRLLGECHALKQEDFHACLQQKGWHFESITPIKLLAKTGSIWELSSGRPGKARHPGRHSRDQVGRLLEWDATSVGAESPEVPGGGDGENVSCTVSPRP